MKLFSTLICFFGILFLAVVASPVPELDTNSMEEAYDYPAETEADETHPTPTTQGDFTIDNEDSTTPTTTTSTTPLTSSTTPNPEDPILLPSQPVQGPQNRPKSEQELYAGFHSKYPALGLPSTTPSSSQPTSSTDGGGENEVNTGGRSLYEEDSFGQSSSSSPANHPYFYPQLVSSHYDYGVQLYRLSHTMNQNMGTVMDFLNRIDNRVTAIVRGRIASLQEADKKMGQEIGEAKRVRDAEIQSMRVEIDNNKNLAMGGIATLNQRIGQAVAKADEDRRVNVANFNSAIAKTDNLRVETIQALGKLRKHVDDLVGVHHGPGRGGNHGGGMPAALPIRNNYPLPSNNGGQDDENPVMPR